MVLKVFRCKDKSCEEYMVIVLKGMIGSMINGLFYGKVMFGDVGFD